MVPIILSAAENPPSLWWNDLGKAQALTGVISWAIFFLLRFVGCNEETALVLVSVFFVCLSFAGAVLSLLYSEALVVTAAAVVALAAGIIAISIISAAAELIVLIIILIIIAASVIVSVIKDNPDIKKEIVWLSYLALGVLIILPILIANKY